MMAMTLNSTISPAFAVENGAQIVPRATAIAAIKCTTFLKQYTGHRIQNILQRENITVFLHSKQGD